MFKRFCSAPSTQTWLTLFSWSLLHVQLIFIAYSWNYCESLHLVVSGSIRKEDNREFWVISACAALFANSYSCFPFLFSISHFLLLQLSAIGNMGWHWTKENLALPVPTMSLLSLAAAACTAPYGWLLCQKWAPTVGLSTNVFFCRTYRVRVVFCGVFMEHRRESAAWCQPWLFYSQPSSSMCTAPCG